VTAISSIIGALVIAASQPVPTALEVVKANGSCFDAAFVGQIIETNGFEDLNEVLPRKGDSLWWGGVSSVHVRRLAQLTGHSPKLGWAKAIMSHQPLPTTKVLFFTRTHASGVPIVVHWTILSKPAARAISEAPVKRCG
jgi:hypothetical protein